MTGFGNIFKAEFYKLAKTKAILKILIAIVIIFIVATVLFSFLYNMVGTISLTTSEEITEEDVILAEQMYENHKAAAADNNAMQNMADTEGYILKSTAVVYRYMYENGLSFANIGVFGSLGSLSANAYIYFILSVMGTVITIFAIVTIVRSFAGERSQGTLKMQLLRPISRDAMITAKFLAVFVFSTMLYLFVIVLSCIVGVCAYHFDAKQILTVVNASHVVMISPGVEILIYSIYYIFNTFAFIALGLCLSCLIKKNEGPSIALALIIYLIGKNIEATLGYIFIGYAGFAINSAWLTALTVTGPALNYMNLYSMLALSFVWVVGMAAVSWFSFKKTDINA